MSPSSSSPVEGDEGIPQATVLDACVLLNLHATGRVEEILRSLPSRHIVSTYAAGESLWYLEREPSTGVLERRDVALGPLIGAGLLEVVDLTSEEQVAFVAFAQQLGDGEAASGALAIGRSAAVATDDRRAREVFGSWIPPIRVIGTTTLLRSWELRAGIDPGEVASTLRAVRFGARFQPSDDDDEVAWWRERMREVSRR
jgi:hypothetical protein